MKRLGTAVPMCGRRCQWAVILSGSPQSVGNLPAAPEVEPGSYFKRPSSNKTIIKPSTVFLGVSSLGSTTTIAKHNQGYQP